LAIGMPTIIAQSCAIQIKYAQSKRLPAVLVLKILR